MKQPRQFNDKSELKVTQKPKQLIVKTLAADPPPTTLAEPTSNESKGNASWISTVL